MHNALTVILLFQYERKIQQPRKRFIRQRQDAPRTKNCNEPRRSGKFLVRKRE
jgi:hypothetical protein